MGGTELVYNLFSECRPDNDNHEGLCPLDPVAVAGPLAQSIGVALLVKGALTIVTFGIKLPAGIFIPTLGVGACFGRILGIGVQYLQHNHPHLSIFSACKDDMDCVVPGLYAMVGAAATLSGVTVCLYSRVMLCISQRSYAFLANDSITGSHHVRAHRYTHLRRTGHAVDTDG